MPKWMRGTVSAATVGALLASSVPVYAKEYDSGGVPSYDRPMPYNPYRLEQRDPIYKDYEDIYRQYYPEDPQPWRVPPEGDPLWEDPYRDY